MKFHGRPQIQILNSVSIPLPLNDSDQEESPMTSYSNYTAEESPTSYEPHEEESTMTSSSADTQGKSPVTSSSSADDKEKSPVTKITYDQHEVKRQSENQTKVS